MKAHRHIDRSDLAVFDGYIAERSNAMAMEMNKLFLIALAEKKSVTPEEIQEAMSLYDELLKEYAGYKADGIEHEMVERRFRQIMEGDK